MIAILRCVARMNVTYDIIKQTINQSMMFQVQVTEVCGQGWSPSYPKTLTGKNKILHFIKHNVRLAELASVKINVTPDSRFESQEESIDTS